MAFRGEPKEHSGCCRTGLVGGGPTEPHPEPRVFCHTVERWACMGQEASPSSLGPVGVCGQEGCRAERARHAGKPGQGLWECWAPGPPAPACSCWRHPQMKALFTRGHGPSGRVRYRQAGAAGRQSFTASKDPQSAFVGGLTRPGRRGAWSTLFPSLCVPTVGRESTAPVPPGSYPGPAPPQRTFIRRSVRLMSTPRSILRS